jgi:hypothetical protein
MMNRKETTCRDCRKWRFCLESSRLYPCIKFERKVKQDAKGKMEGDKRPSKLEVSSRVK